MKLLTVAITTAVLVIGVVIMDRSLPQATANIPEGSSTAQQSTAQQSAEAQIPTDVVFKDLQGEDVRLADLRGKVVLVDFWATWCEPCKIETPDLIEFQAMYASKGFTIIGVAMDDEGKAAVEPYLQTERFDVNGQKEAINYPVVLGTPEIGDKFKIDGYPTGFLISRDGHLLKVFEGLTGHDEMAKEIERAF